MKISINVQGLAQTRRLLTPPNNLIAEPWKKLMEELAQVGAQMAQQTAPMRSGRLRQRTFSRVQRKPFPLWLAIRSRAVRRSPRYPRGYPYPRLLEYSPRHGHMGWFSRGLTSFPARAQAALAKVADVIQKKWKG